MASEDWRSKLGALMGSLPQDTETEAEETNDVSNDDPIEILSLRKKAVVVKPPQ